MYRNVPGLAQPQGEDGASEWGEEGTIAGRSQSLLVGSLSHGEAAIAATLHAGAARTVQFTVQF
jgi:hypothetical protein